MSGGTQKICPRKFSEKIALLNQKEAEGNAKFEEIIKEVQATKSSTSVIVRQSGQPNDKPADKGGNQRNELEEVFESLIKCVGQYEDELLESQAQKFGSIQALPENKQLIEQTSELTARSASAEIFLNQVNTNLSPGNLPYNAQPELSNQDCSNSSIQVISQLPLSHQDNNLSYNVSYDNQPPQQTFRVYSNGSKGTFNDQSGGAMRTRVTSIGSASYKKYLCAAGQQLMRNDRVGQVSGVNWPDASGVYLSEPNQDKSWQKSSSVPALHVPHVPLNNGISNSNNSPTDSPMRQIIQCPSNMKHNAQLCNQQTENAKCTGGCICEQPVNTFVSGAGLGSSEQMLVGSAACYHSPQAQVITNFAQNQDPTSMDVIEVDNSQLATDAMEHAGTLPGIKICAFEDESSRRVVQTCVEHRDDSLPDMNLLQFTGQAVANDNEHSRSSQEDQVRPYAKHSQTVLYNDQELNRVQQQRQQQQTALPKEEKQMFYDQSHNTHYDQQMPKYIQYDMSATPAPQPPSSIPYMPAATLCTKLADNCNLSNSVGGLANTADRNNLNASIADLNNNIIRSHSHNSIDNLTKHKMQANHSNGRSGPYQRANPVDQHPMHNQCPDQSYRSNLKARPLSHQLYYFNNSHQVDSALARCYSSNSSMQPQYGSMSPLNSSSNLASPQSNQDSPGGCEEVDLNNNSGVVNLYNADHTNENLTTPMNDWQSTANQLTSYEQAPQPYQGDPISDPSAYDRAAGQPGLNLAGQQQQHGGMMVTREAYEPMKTQVIGGQRTARMSTDYPVIAGGPLISQQLNSANPVEQPLNVSKVAGATCNDLLAKSQFYSDNLNSKR